MLECRTIMDYKGDEIMQTISITPKAKEFILKSGNTITLEPVHARVC